MCTNSQEGFLEELFDLLLRYETCNPDQSVENIGVEVIFTNPNSKFIYNGERFLKVNNGKLPS